MGERSVSSVEKSANVRRCGGRVRGLVEEGAQTWGKRVVGCGEFAWQKQINVLVIAIFVAET